ncbi:MAG: hypothetical protein QXG73_02575, partial [Candidatus Micrarchaeaceae archaeon]
VVDVKDSNGDFRNFTGLLSKRPEAFLIFQSQDNLLFQSFEIGTNGGICCQQTSQIFQCAYKYICKRGNE